MKQTSFATLETVPEGPGLYDIRTKAGEYLKIGIAGNLRKRLSNHARSRQGCLKLRAGGSWTVPDDVRSKQSILAKHLYFDRSVTKSYDLTTEAGRREFLVNECIVGYESHPSRELARRKEEQFEAKNIYRYQGRTRIR
jgi:hypothetical protein